MKPIGKIYLSCREFVNDRLPKPEHPPLGSGLERAPAAQRLAAHDEPYVGRVHPVLNPGRHRFFQIPAKGGGLMTVPGPTIRKPRTSRGEYRRLRLEKLRAQGRDRATERDAARTRERERTMHDFITAAE